jgi:hypothetical protein
VLSGEVVDNSVKEKLSAYYRLEYDETILALVVKHAAFSADENLVLTDRRIVADQRDQQRTARLSDLSSFHIPFCRTKLDSYVATTRHQPRGTTIEIRTYIMDDCKKFKAIFEAVVENRLSWEDDPLSIPERELEAAPCITPPRSTKTSNSP